MNTVDPIRDPKKILAIKRDLKIEPNPRNYLLFVMGINLALRPGDLLKLKVSDILDNKGNIKDYLYIETSKSKKEKKKKIAINQAIKEAIDYYLSKAKVYDPDQYLFKSKKNNKPISNVGLFYLIKQWAQDVGLENERLSGHSLRKTWGYQARVYHGASIEQVAEKLGHRSTAVTRRYIGINQEEINNLEKEINI